MFRAGDLGMHKDPQNYEEVITQGMIVSPCTLFQLLLIQLQSSSADTSYLRRALQKTVGKSTTYLENRSELDELGHIHN
jgi:hypothetical protein